MCTMMFLTAQKPTRRAPKSPAGSRPERRGEQRLRYLWPVWYSCDGCTDIQQGRMVDLCSGGASFQAPGEDYPEVGAQVWLRSSHPLTKHGAFAITSFTNVGRVLRSNQISPLQHRISVQFGIPLEHSPTQTASEGMPALGHST